MLDADLAGLDGALQCLPGEGGEQQLARIEQQVAAVRPMQRAGLDEQKVGHQRAHLGDVLDAADDVAVNGVELLDDRRAGGGIVAVGDHYIDHVAAEPGVPRGVHRLPDDGVLLLAGGEKESDVAGQVLTGRAQIVERLRHVGERSHQVVERGVDGALGHLLVEHAQVRAALLVGLGHALEDDLQVLLQGLNLALDLLAHRLG